MTRSAATGLPTAVVAAGDPGVQPLKAGQSRAVPKEAVRLLRGPWGATKASEGGGGRTLRGEGRRQLRDGEERRTGCRPIGQACGGRRRFKRWRRV